MPVSKLHYLVIAMSLPLLVFTGLYIGWVVGGAFNELPRMIGMFIGGIMGLILGSLFIYWIVKRLILTEVVKTRKPAKPSSA